jgi:hypothetical protein
MPFERLTQKKPNISHNQTFGGLELTSIHGDLRKKVDNLASKYVLLGYKAETSTQY